MSCLPSVIQYLNYIEQKYLIYFLLHKHGVTDHLLFCGSGGGGAVWVAKRYVNMKYIQCFPFLPMMFYRYSVHLFVLVLMCYGIMVTASASNVHR